MTPSGQLVLKDICLSRGGRRLIEGVSMALEPGGAALILGPNGAGKSSLLRMIAGFLEPERGEVGIKGGVALATDTLALDSSLSFFDALSFWARLDGQGAEAVMKAMAALGLTPLAAVPVRMLSTGQRKRATLARVIASGAPVWLLDEPANGLDQASIAMLEAAIAQHRATGGIVLIATHQPLALPDAVRLEVGA